jgi:DegV family protein with EDD domain
MAMKIQIVTDSTADLTKDIIKKHNIIVVPLTVTLGDESFKDGIDITPDKIADYVKKSGQLPKTAAPSISDYKDIFCEIAKTETGILHFSMSSDMSASYQSALVASQDYKNVYVIDTRSLSTGIALLILYANELIEKGLDIKEIYNKVLTRIPYVNVSFIIDDLTYLHKSGRCSNLAFFGANLLRLKPSINVKNGKMIAGKKYRGNISIAVQEYVKDILKQNTNIDSGVIFITHSMIDYSIVESVKKIILEESHFKQISEAITGSTIFSHCGQNSLGLLFINKI